MDRIELHDVEYGDCTVLVGRDQSVLMVDCGSVSQYVRRDQTDITQRFDAIFHRYTAASARYFLLTHYHRDHMNGFLRKLRQDPNYFDWVCLPALPYADGRCPILGIALYAHFFSAPQSDFAQVNTACLTIYDLLHNTVGAARICTLRAGDSFMFDRTVYEVLSPGADFAYDPALFDAAASLDAAMEQIPETAGFLRLKAEYLSAYAACQAALSPTGMDRDAALERLSAVWRELDALRGTPALLAAAEPVQEILYAPALRQLYIETQNDLSLVFQNRRSASEGFDILLTGDVSGKVLDALSTKLYSSYYAVKAPHHGTESHWSAVLGQMEIAHLLISNGDYHAGGEVSGRYIAMESVKHCTNPSACVWFRENGSCCNRLLRCYEQPAAGQLTLKCSAAAGNRFAPCRIYVFGHNGVRGCHCDR
ncbi:MAG: hypothetical protein IJF56_02615 [Clostridia bacterium]|nr:hypothetical protein [Clostridia bacterium]